MLETERTLTRKEAKEILQELEKIRHSLRQKLSVVTKIILKLGRTYGLSSSQDLEGDLAPL
jgi:hypothetical protein